MKLKLVMSLLLTASTIVVSADSVQYSYDASGNCIKREIAIQSRASVYDDHIASKSEMRSENTVKIHPNPTSGHLTVGISGYNEADQYKIRIFNLTGAQVFSTSIINSPTIEIDITEQPKGIYILSLSHNDKTYSWKIIKQ